MQISDNFRHAIGDYTLLLEKHYPEKTILELVSTRYALNHFERSMLYRGVTSREKAEKRRERIITVEELNNRTLHVDLFNVLFTLAAYLRGFPVYQAMDGLLRDASESHDSHEWVQHLEKALDLLLHHLEDCRVPKAIIYLDNPLHLSGYFSWEIDVKAESLKMEIEVVRDESPDHLIIKSSDGVVCTSDSVIIDKTERPVFDLARYILSNAFKKEIFSIETIQEKSK